MHGLEAINYANGWAMAGVGATIVITGLSVLSYLISQFHHLASFFEDQDTITKTEVVENSVPKILSGEINEVSKIYMSITNDKLGNNFYLTDLYKLSNSMGLPHPYISIRDFRNFGILISSGEDLFSWK